IALADGSIKHVHGVGRPVLEESGEVHNYTGTTVDITEHKRRETLFSGEKRLLEMIATGVALEKILNRLCVIIEEYRSGTLASILLLRPDGLHLDSVAGPSLPKGWRQEMEKLPIGPCAGSCGTAAYRGSPVIVSDIASDPLWEVPEHRAAALGHGLRASWSNPILSSEGKVLGTFCIYGREPQSPSAHDLGVMEKAEGSFRFERKFLRDNGEVIPVEVSLSALRGRYYQAIIRDISQRKRREALLAGENRVLEMLAKGDSLADILDLLCLLVEEQS